MALLLKISFIFVSIFYAVMLFPQMPDWKLFRDNDGNTYYIDPDYRIHITGNPEYIDKPVSSAGIDYYLHHALDLIERHKYVEGVTILKSIMALEETDGAVYRARIKASGIINGLAKKYGERYDGIDKSASLLIIRKNKDTIGIINDRMNYSLAIPGEVRVIRKKTREKGEYRYCGLSMGIRLKKERAGGAPGDFDMIIAIDAERYSVQVRDINRGEEIWRYNLGHDVFVRKEIVKGDRTIMYRINKADTPVLWGYELIGINKKIIYIVRMISAAEISKMNDDFMISVMKELKMTGGE